ncbi:MAG: rod shape-determining protein MreD [Oscillochloridaceae bacterium]|nr:rod shape-determining protein MreD [Chloroflexaceae bacterium]MDW8389938.1 rod shape-determining protein MreD [Oscillochloridaceae bacterium]
MGDTQPRRLEEALAHEAGRIAGSFALACVQVTLLGLPGGFTLPLVPVLAICRTLLGVSAAFPDVSLGRALRWALYGGLALDVFAATPLGVHALALLLAVLAVAALTRRLRVERPAVPLLAVLVGMLIYEMVLAPFLQPGPVEWQRYLLVVVLPSVVVALTPTLPLFFLLRRLLRSQL